MKSVIRLAIVDPQDSTRAMLKNMLLGVDMVWLEAECSRYEFFIDVISQSQPDIVLVAIDGDTTKALSLVAEINRDFPSCSTLVVSASTEGSLILQAMRHGAKEFLNLPLEIDDFIAAIDRIKQTLSTSSGDGEVHGSQVISVAGVSGGVGCTSLAVNLACSFAQNEKNSVALIDLDLALGDADVWLDIIPDYTIQDVAENITRLDYSLLKRSLTMHECGLYLLPRPVEMTDDLPINEEGLRRVISLLKATFTHLVIDLSKTYSEYDMAAIDCSDVTLLVTQLDLPCLRNVVRMAQYFDSRTEIKEKLKVVLNRHGLSDSQISLSKAMETIGREIYWQVPNDYATMVESRNNGVPLIVESPKAKLTKSIVQLSHEIGGTSQADAKGEKGSAKTKKSLFSFLGSK